MFSFGVLVSVKRIMPDLNLYILSNKIAQNTLISAATPTANHKNNY
jgi:hypothetical protein